MFTLDLETNKAARYEVHGERINHGYARLLGILLLLAGWLLFEPSVGKTHRPTSYSAVTTQKARHWAGFFKSL